VSTFTVVYALTRDLRFGTDLREVPQHECYHHLARVTAPSVERAIARCRRDAISGFDFQLLIAVVGEPELIAIGKCLVHAFVDGDDP
jgi:hypothetical protein